MEFIDIKHDFFFVSYGRSIITNDSFELLKQTIAKLSEKFGFILWDHPDILTEAEGIEFTKHCLGSKHLKGIIFALDEDIYDDTDIALKIALDYCVNKDIEYYQKNENKKNKVPYGGGFRRLLISLSNDPLTLIHHLNEKYSNFFDPTSICYKYDDKITPAVMSYKISLAFDTFNDYNMEFVTAYFDSTTKIYKDKKKFNSKDIQSLLEKNHGHPVIFDWSEKISFEEEEDRILSEFTDKPIYVIYDNKIYNLSPFGKENYVLMSEAPFAYLYYAAPKGSRLASFASALVIQKQSKRIQRIFQKTIQQTKNNKEPFTFISYSHKDNISGKPVTKFAHELETIGMNVFFDDFNFIPGVNWYEVAEKAILDYRCKYMLCFISSNYIQSQACIQEIETALKQRVTILLFDPNQILKDSNLLSEYRRKRCVHIVNNRKELLKFYNLRSLNKKMKEKNITSFYNLNDLNEASQSFFISNIRSEQKELETEINEKNLNITIDGKSYTIQKYKTPVEKYFLTNEIVEIYSEYSTNEFIPYSEKIQRSLGVGIISSIFLILLFGFYVDFCITEHAPLPITIIVSMFTLLWVLAPLYIIVSFITIKHLEKSGHKIDISKILKTKGLIQNDLAEYAFYNLANEGYFEEK